LQESIDFVHEEQEFSNHYLTVLSTTKENKYSSMAIDNDPNSEICLNLIENYLSSEIWNISNNSDVYGFTCISKKTLVLFLKKLDEAYFNILVNEDELSKQMYFLHKICNGLYEYNEQTLQMSYDRFRSSILFPNLIYLLIRYFTKAKGFLQALNRKIFNEHKSRNIGLIQKFINSYYIDEDVIKSDVLYSFLGNGLKKFNPLKIDNLNAFYSQSLRSIYYYYFKSDRNFNVVFMELQDIDSEISSSFSIPTRLIHYRDVLYEIQIEKMCEDSITMGQLGYNYNIFKNVILDNEFQNMYYSLHNDSFTVKNNQFKLMNLYSSDYLEEKEKQDGYLLEELKKLPLIYKLLRCIHIVNPKHKSYGDAIKPSNIKLIVLEELMHPFKHLFSEEYIYGILENTAENFVNKILHGEYINPITFTTIKINHYSFINQLKRFVQLCIEEIGLK
jgi:hypothetical protein